MEAQTGADLDKAKNSIEGFGVLSARTGSWQLDSADARSSVPPVGIAICKHAAILPVGNTVCSFICNQVYSFIDWLSNALIVQA